jgi:hypothetical protein
MSIPTTPFQYPPFWEILEDSMTNFASSFVHIIVVAFDEIDLIFCWIRLFTVWVPDLSIHTNVRNEIQPVQSGQTLEHCTIESQHKVSSKVSHKFEDKSRNVNRCKLLKMSLSRALMELSLNSRLMSLFSAAKVLPSNSLILL